MLLSVERKLYHSFEQGISIKTHKIIQYELLGKESTDIFELSGFLLRCVDIIFMPVINDDQVVLFIIL